jgi:hypothetical protein
MGMKRKAYRIFVLKPEGERRQGRPEHRWKGNIKIKLCQIAGGDIE